jgi:deazaflavin-dependent oxidoreductase (nitroreductase family)
MSGTGNQGLAAELGITTGRRSFLGAGIRRFASTGPGNWLSSKILRHLDRAVLWASFGRYTISTDLAGVPTLFLTTTGARSGRPRTVQLIAVPAGDDLAVIGSAFGGRKHPGWVHNLDADPRATAGYRDRRVEVTAQELTGPEAEQVWARGRTLNPGFADYPRRAGTRRIRVFRLEPWSDNASSGNSSSKS